MPGFLADSISGFGGPTANHGKNSAIFLLSGVDGVGARQYVPRVFRRQAVGASRS